VLPRAKLHIYAFLEWRAVKIWWCFFQKSRRRVKKNRHQISKIPDFIDFIRFSLHVLPRFAYICSYAGNMQK
jgi:hypothetical protein